MSDHCLYLASTSDPVARTENVDDVADETCILNNGTFCIYLLKTIWFLLITSVVEDHNDQGVNPPPYAEHSVQDKDDDDDAGMMVF